MRGRPFTMTWSPDDSPEALKGAYLDERDGVFQTRLHWCWLPNLTTPQIAGAVRGLEQQTDLKGLAWDRGPSHRTAEVRDVGMPLVELPPYSPELNPAERVFEELRRVVEGKVYPTLDAKLAAVVAHLEWLDADPARVRSLANWPWITAACQQVPSQNAP